jgi:hypothetical protein
MQWQFQAETYVYESDNPRAFRSLCWKFDKEDMDDIFQE